MITHDRGEMFIECDNCGDCDPLDSTEFNDAVKEAKRKGWVAYKNGGEWEHKCPACVEDHSEKASPERLFR